MQKDKGVGGFLNKKEGGQGALGIFALLSFLLTAEEGREERLAGGGPGRRLRARGRLWSEGKERGRGKSEYTCQDHKPSNRIRARIKSHVYITE